ncbi:ClpXP protease specificity-enhancing factor [Marinagarivorans algicola]|uniref:ClpXP protease specificity-enhancing factor n=1 Tax=Marinagarivorans algicola TaxID=1513270 RepID=UPI0006B8EB62|nr:ClpXP protease specificity-enhancing factor [Marinagarivorans algicola]
MTMTSSRPYLIRALYEWINDNNLTPYLLVNANEQDVSVPQDFVGKDGQIILNVAPNAIMGLDMSNDAISFNARFGGVPTDLYVPNHAVMGIYAKENGKGMMFEPEPTPPSTPPKETKPKEKSVKKPILKVVK